MTLAEVSHNAQVKRRRNDLTLLLQPSSAVLVRQLRFVASFRFRAVSVGRASEAWCALSHESVSGANCLNDAPVADRLPSLYTARSIR